jgi:hypothetical protein
MELKIDKDRIDVLCRLAESANQSFERRASVEWKVSFGLWTALGLFAAFIVKRDVCLTHPYLLRAAVIVVTALICYVYACIWTAGLFDRNKHDKERAMSYWKQVEEAVGTSFKYSATAPEEKSWRDNWSNKAQVWFTLLLCVLAVVSVFAVT